MRVPGGRTIRSRIVQEPAGTLAVALECGTTGYLRLTPQESMLLGGESAILVLEAGIPRAVFVEGEPTAGRRAIDAVTVPGPCRAELVELDAAVDVEEPGWAEAQVPPTLPADRLGGSRTLIERTRERAPDAWLSDANREEGSSVEAFLADDDAIAALKERAREEAARRAEEWGFEEAIDGGLDGEPAGDRGGAIDGDRGGAIDEGPDGD